ncbi:hypothetical protein M0804_001867 [Polistes exclamans]|nr:hypothetical protein M0804_001867 [Polistes exclamans]
MGEWVLGWLGAPSCAFLKVVEVEVGGSGDDGGGGGGKVMVVVVVVVVLVVVVLMVVVDEGRKQVSPRKTGFIRKILIFIHTHLAAGRWWWWFRQAPPSVIDRVEKRSRNPSGTKSGWRDYPFL